jgi:diketogulonate reductase-like aldo/keto reductase
MPGGDTRAAARIGVRRAGGEACDGHRREGRQDDPGTAGPGRAVVGHASPCGAAPVTAALTLAWPASLDKTRRVSNGSRDTTVSRVTTPQVPDDTVILAQGTPMPLLGFGTWQIRGEEAVRATRVALEAGYRHLDTATVYRNEGEVGRGLAESGVPREDVFITTKCPGDHVGRGLEALRRSLELLGTDHVDLWLIHWPAEGGANVDLWRELVEAREAGLAREIGVSNFDATMLDAVTDATHVPPAVNQIEWSPLLYDAETVAEHRERNVVLEGYSALRGGTLTHPTIHEIASRLGRTPAQVIIRWHLQHQIVVIPKSVEPDRIRSNADVAGFELSERDMGALDALGSA